MIALKKTVIGTLAVFFIGLSVGAPEADAAEAVKVNFLSKNLNVRVDNGKNTYEHTQIKVKKTRGVKIKSITYKQTNDRVIGVSKKGVVRARRAGKSKVKVVVRYKKSSGKKVIKKVFRITVTVKNKLLVEIPKTGMQYDENGLAKPIYPYTKQESTHGVYSNEASYITRFPVYVETDYDTDQDGKRDLVMAYVQVPRSAVEGYYQAPVVMNPNPYLVAGVTRPDPEKLSQRKNGAFDYQKLSVSPAPRTPKSEVSTAEAAGEADDWVAAMEDNGYNLFALDYQDYFLIRGYAFVTSPGPGGSKDCDGLQMCGERIEAEDYAAIVEWLHGDRTAYADRKGTKKITADWCNGHTAMTGHSYCGTLAYEVATLGVKGLDTIFPSGAIASWYDYVYSQGVLVNGMHYYMTYLGEACAKRYMYGSKKEEKSDPAFSVYKNYVMQRNYDGCLADGHYNEYWDRFAYHRGGQLQVPALIIQGLNEVNVRSKQAELMRRAFAAAGQPAKLVLHQGEHDALSDSIKVIDVNGEYFDDLVNRWLAHYMAGIDNGIDRMKDYTVQSNVDGSWTSYNENEKKRSTYQLKPDTVHATETVTSKGNTDSFSLDNPNMTALKKHSAIWEQSFTEDTTLAGTGEVHLRVKMPDAGKNSPILSVQLVDECDQEFNAFTNNPDLGEGYGLVYSYEKEKIDSGPGLEPKYRSYFGQQPTTYKMVSQGWINLLMPGSGWEPESCTAPSEAVKDDTYYDYTLYLQPTVYEVKKGHTLRLYVSGFDGMGEDPACVKLVNTYTDKMSDLMKVAKKYSFTIDNTKSYFTIPKVEA